jgi:AAA15 family ATPase/GTPase
MFKTIKIENFRGFQSLELQQLGRVNLLVGTNNSGKTSILEAIQLLCSRTNLEPLVEPMTKRGEFFFGIDSRSNRELDICHLFYGHDIKSGSKLTISGINGNEKEVIFGSIKPRPISSKYEKNSYFSEELRLFDEANELIEAVFTLHWSCEDKNELSVFPVSPSGGLSLDYVRRFWRDIDRTAIPTQFVTSSSLTTEQMIKIFDRQVVLTSEETIVLEALQTIEPKIERIASVNPPSLISSSDSRRGFFVRLSDSSLLVPIGSMGDGIWRILGLALSTISARGGVLLIDEIDTGLHFTVMSDMWKLIWKMANRLNLQVFATTHNSDCWTSLATIASQEDAMLDGITIQHIKSGKETSIVFTEREIVIAAERGLEVR